MRSHRHDIDSVGSVEGDTRISFSSWPAAVFQTVSTVGHSTRLSLRD